MTSLGIAVWRQQRHNDAAVKLLQSLRGERLELAIVPTGSKLAGIGRYVGVIDSIDPSTRWVTFEWIDWSGDGQPLLGALLTPDRLASTGVIADCIRWVRPATGPKIDLV